MCSYHISCGIAKSCPVMGCPYRLRLSGGLPVWGPDKNQKKTSQGQLFATTRSRLPRSSCQSAQRHENVPTPGHPHHSLGGARNRAQSQAQGAGPGPGSWPRAQPGLPGPGPRLRHLPPTAVQISHSIHRPARNTEPVLHGRSQHRTCFARSSATQNLFCTVERNTPFYKIISVRQMLVLCRDTQL